MSASISQVTGWTAASSGWSVVSLAGVIVLVVMVVIIVGVSLLILNQHPWGLLGRPRRAGAWSAHDELIHEAAAEDVAAIEADAKLVRPDAPGNHLDEL